MYCWPSSLLVEMAQLVVGVEVVLVVTQKVLLGAAQEYQKGQSGN